MELTRLHYRRLRHYWRGSGASLTDGIDLDLVAAKLITRRERMGGVFFAITPDGEEELHAESQREIARRAPHHELAGRLAQFLRDKGRVTWENIELMALKEGGQRQLIRPDVYSLNATYNEKNLSPHVHEVKVSRSDFLADLARPDKRAGYAAVAESVCYVVPVGMVEPNEVPAGCGLLVEINQGAFEQVKKAAKRPIQLSVATFMRLVLKPGNVLPLV